MWSGTRKMRLTNGMAGFQSLPFLTNQKIISVIFWLVHIIQSDSCVNSQSNFIGAESCDLLVGNPRFSLVAENRFWLVNGAGPIRPWSDFVGCDRVSRGWEQWGVSRTRLSWPMCWVLGAWFNMAKNVVLLCKVPVDKRCVLSWTAVTPTNSLHQGDRPASLANPTGTRRGDSVIMTLFSHGVSAGQKRQPNNTVGAAAVHPDDELPTERWTHEKI